MNIIGANIRKLRKLNRLNQIEFSTLIGISQGNLSEIEQGNCNPSLDTLLSLKQYFRCSLDELLLKQEITPGGIHNYSDISIEEVDLISNYRILDIYDRKEVEEIIKIKIKNNLLRKEEICCFR